MTSRRVAAALAALALAAGCSDGATRPSGSTASGASDASDAASSAPAQGTVAIEGFVFAPKTVRMARGTTVTWRNDDDAVHSVVAADRTTFASELLDKGGEFTYTPTRQGTIEYICGVHQYMTGTLVVE